MPPKRINTDGSPSPQSSHSRDSSNASARHAHAPATPSQLRHAHAPSDRSSSPEDTMHPRPHHDAPEPSSSNEPSRYDFATDGAPPPNTDYHDMGSMNDNHVPLQSGIIEIDLEPNERTGLLNQTPDGSRNAGSSFNRHSISPRPAHRSYGSFAGSIHSEHSFGGAFPGITETAEDAPDAAHALLGDALGDSVTSSNGKHMSTTRWLAERHGIKSQRMMYAI